jgi:hypothetical protein
LENYGTHHVNDGNHLVDCDSNGKDKYGGVPLPCLINGGRVFEYINIYTHIYIYTHIPWEYEWECNMDISLLGIGEREKERERDRYIYIHIFIHYI